MILIIKHLGKGSISYECEVGFETVQTGYTYRNHQMLCVPFVFVTNNSWFVTNNITHSHLLSFKIETLLQTDSSVAKSLRYSNEVFVYHKRGQ